MSFTSTLSVRTRAVIVHVVELFLQSSRSMENILQSLVKIIIIGALYEKTNVDCNRQFLPPPPPLPYYQNEDYYIPGFAPAFHDHLPAFYPERNLPNPTSFQNIKTYTPPQLFYQNDNYIPPPMANPGLSYSLPQPLRYKQPQGPPQKPNFAFSRVQYKDSPQAQPARPQQLPQKKTEAFASNIIVKEEPLSPYYQDDYGKNYNDEDYTDSYSDDSSAPPKPCTATDPYRYFQAPKGTPDSDRSSPCNPAFQPNFGSSVYTLKVPITLLPSRFPPRVEQLIERIQNYFSTYTQQQTPKPQNETSPASSTPAPVAISTESAPQSTTVEVVLKNNRTGESQQETSSGIASIEEEITEKMVVVATETTDSQTSSATAPDAQAKNGLQIEAQTTPRVDEVTASVPDAVTNQVQGVTKTATEANPSKNQQPVGDFTPSGDGKSRNYFLPEELQSVGTSSTTPAGDLNRDNQSGVITPTNGSFQATDSNNG